MTDEVIKEQIAEKVHAAMVWAASIGGPPKSWQGGNSHAEDHARKVATEAIAATLAAKEAELAAAKAREAKLREALPDYIDLYRTIRAAGRSNADKARAVHAALLEKQP